MRSISLIFADLLLIAGAACVAIMLRDNPALWIRRLSDLLPYLSFALLCAAIILPVGGISHNLWRYSTINDFIRIALAALVIVLASTMATFAYNRLDGLARAIPVLHAILIVMLMYGFRAFIRQRHGSHQRARVVAPDRPAVSTENVLLVGDNAITELFIRSVYELAADAIAMVGILSTNEKHLGRKLHGISILGGPDHLTDVLRQIEVHGIVVNRIVVVMTPSELSQKARDCLQDVEDGTGIAIDYFSERLGFFRRPSPTAGEPIKDDISIAACNLPTLLDLTQSRNLSRPFWRMKRIFDLVVSLILIIVTAPAMAMVALAVAADLGNPILFWQERPGALGQKLRLYKFRTMRSAHSITGERIDENLRASRIGSFLRRSRLDELPQLFHIFKGEMSFVGPRPLLASEQSMSFAARLSVRPGLTGWAQVHGGRTVSVEDKVALDVWYIRNASFRLDMLIALKTIRMLLLGEKADARAIAAAWSDMQALRTLS